MTCVRAPEMLPKVGAGKSMWRRWCRECGKSEIVRSDLRNAKTCLPCARKLWHKPNRR